MQPATQLCALIVGLICLATHFSYAASIVPNSRRSSKLPFPSKPLFPFNKDHVKDFVSFDQTYRLGMSNSTTDDKTLQKRWRKDPTEYWAVLAKPKLWKIKATGRFLEDQKPKQSLWISEMHLNGRKLGQGGQGSVTEGKVIIYDEEFLGTISQDVPRLDCDDEKDAAIKESKGLKGYTSAQIMSAIRSEHIVSVYAYAKKAIRTPGKEDTYKSMVAFEKLDEDAEKLIRLNRLSDISPVIGAVVGAARDSSRRGIYNLDLKLDNIMVDNSKSPEGKWKVIDWDMIDQGDPQRYQRGSTGTRGYLPPEMLAYMLDRKTKVSWTADRAETWTIGMVLFYIMFGEYKDEVTTEMKDYSKKILNKPVKSVNDPIWYWVYLMLAYSKNEDIPGKVFPEGVRNDEKMKGTMEWFNRVLCKEEDRWTLKETLDSIDF